MSQHQPITLFPSVSVVYVHVSVYALYLHALKELELFVKTLFICTYYKGLYAKFVRSMLMNQGRRGANLLPFAMHSFRHSEFSLRQSERLYFLWNLRGFVFRP